MAAVPISKKIEIENWSTTSIFLRPAPDEPGTLIPLSESTGLYFDKNIF